jgi:Tol biopolymer transport system component
MPETFAQGIISTAGNNEFCASFAPDGSEFYFNRGMTIMVCRLEKADWTAPEPASFNGNYRNHEAHLAFDNKRIFFGSSRPPHPYGIWLTERSTTGWSEPRRMWDGMYVTTAKNGNIYFGVEFPSPAHFVISKHTDTGYVSLTKQEIKFADSHRAGQSIFHPAIAPDDSFIIFDDNKELYVSFRESDGSWGMAIPLNEMLKEQIATIPAISPDGKYLFFTSHGDIHWVDTKIIGMLRRIK